MSVNNTSLISSKTPLLWDLSSTGILNGREFHLRNGKLSIGEQQAKGIFSQFLKLVSNKAGELQKLVEISEGIYTQIKAEFQEASNDLNYPKIIAHLNKTRENLIQRAREQGDSEEVTDAIIDIKFNIQRALDEVREHQPLFSRESFFIKETATSLLSWLPGYSYFRPSKERVARAKLVKVNKALENPLVQKDEKLLKHLIQIQTTLNLIISESDKDHSTLKQDIQDILNSLKSDYFVNGKLQDFGSYIEAAKSEEKLKQIDEIIQAINDPKNARTEKNGTDARKEITRKLHSLKQMYIAISQLDFEAEKQLDDAQKELDEITKSLSDDLAKVINLQDNPSESAKIAKGLVRYAIVRGGVATEAGRSLAAGTLNVIGTVAPMVSDLLPMLEDYPVATIAYEVGMLALIYPDAILKPAQWVDNKITGGRISKLIPHRVKNAYSAIFS